MIRRSLPLAWPALLLGALVTLPPTAAAEPRVLPDSTVLDISQLSNGLRVVVRHLPRTSHVAITLAWPTGSDSDPPGQLGRAALLAELLMMAGAGDAPERTREELDILRPDGWGAGVSPRVTQITEIGTRAQFPGLVRQMAQRLRGVTVNDSSLSRALVRVRGDVRAQRSPTSNAELYVAARDVARGSYDPGAAEAGLRALAKVKVADVQSLLGRTFVPTGAVLSLAGNLGEMNLPALIQNEFGSIPAGTRLAAPEPQRLTKGNRDLKRDGLPGPAGTLAIIAPALEDSLHPSFYLSMLFLGGYASKQWKAPAAPLTSRFQYSLFDDPDLARFYPQPGPGTAADTALDLEFNELVSKMGTMMFPPESFDAVLRGVAWLVGAPLPRETLLRARREPRLLATLSSNQAVRELWGGEPFWNEYRRKLVPDRFKEFHIWVGYLLDQSNRVRVLLRPSR
ncbi:MAG: hypothetical protein ABIS67_08345 [Candidatus Eisenbacteria bacterium]